MINIEFFKKQIEAMDVKSDAFFELYKAIYDKYWTFENPDEHQAAAKTLSMYAERGEPEQVLTCLNIINNVFMMDHRKENTCAGELEFEDKTYFYTVSTDKDGAAKLKDILGKISKGNVSIKESNNGNQL